MDRRLQDSGTHRLLPKHHLVLALGHEGDASVLRNDDRQAVRMIVDEAVGGTVTSADVFHVFGASSSNPIGSDSVLVAGQCAST